MNTTIKGILIAATAMALAVSCNSKKICKYKPSPIFEQGLPHTQDYRYEESGVQSLESMWLDRGVLVEVYQEVCDATRQEFRFTVQGPGAQFQAWPDSLWFKEASREMAYLSGLGPNQKGLKPWADVVDEARSQMKLGEDFEIQEGIKIRVDKVIGPEQSTLLLVLAQD